MIRNLILGVAALALTATAASAGGYGYNDYSYGYDSYNTAGYDSGYSQQTYHQTCSEVVTGYETRTTYDSYGCPTYIQVPVYGTSCSYSY